MAQFDFYGVWQDSRDYLEQLVAAGRFTFVVDMWYHERVPFRFTSLTEEVERVLQRRSRVYMFSAEYSRFPPDFGNPTPTGNLMIDPCRGGPALDLTLPREDEDKKGRPCLGGGMLFYQPVYQDPESGELYKPPEALKRAFQDVQTMLRRGMVRRYRKSQKATTDGVIKPAIWTFWIGRHAAAELDSGARGIEFAPVWDKDWMTGADFARSKDELGPLVDEYA